MCGIGHSRVYMVSPAAAGPLMGYCPVQSSSRRWGLRRIAGQSADNAHFALRVGDADAVVAKRLPDGDVQRRFEVALPLFRVVQPDCELEVDAVLGELEDVDQR